MKMRNGSSGRRNEAINKEVERFVLRETNMLLELRESF